MTFATHLERQFMQRLRGLEASALPPSPRLVQTLLQKAGSKQQNQAEKRGPLSAD